jgi:molybdopterin-guanine dinucleotide biosynthesis protein B
MIPHVAFVGWSGSGKTTLLEKVVAILGSRGFDVAVIKHSHHEPDEVPGKDTARYRAAGASRVVFAGPTSFTLWRDSDQSVALEELLNLCQGADLVIVEGFKSHPGPKLEVRRGEVKPIAEPRTGLIAVVSDQPGDAVKEGLAWLDLNWPEQVADFIVRYLGLEPRRVRGCE